jgi:hypothetical protein
MDDAAMGAASSEPGGGSAAGDPLAGPGGDGSAAPEAEPDPEAAGEDGEYAGTDGGIERAAPGAVPADESGDGGGSGIVATLLSAPAALVGAVVAIPAAILAWIAALPRTILGAIPTFGIPAAIGEARVLLGSEWYSDEVATMARYAWLGRVALAAVVWAVGALVMPGATLVPSATVGSLSVVVIAVLLSHVGYDLLLSVGAELEPGCHGGASADPPLRGVALFVVTYALGVGVAVGTIWRTESLAAPLLGDRPIGALPDGVVSAPEPALAAVAGLLLVIVSLLGLLSAALTLPWSDRYDRHYHVLPGLWQAPLSIVLGVLALAVLTGGTLPLLGRQLGLLQLGLAAGGLPIVAAFYLVRRALESPDPQPAW